MDLGPAIEYPVLEALACQEGVAPRTPAISTSPFQALQAAQMLSLDLKLGLDVVAWQKHKRFLSASGVLSGDCIANQLHCRVVAAPGQCTVVFKIDV